jgi:hypothetical protein
MVQGLLGLRSALEVLGRRCGSGLWQGLIAAGRSSAMMYISLAPFEDEDRLVRPAGAATGLPPGHPEHLRPDVALTPLELAYQRELDGEGRDLGWRALREVLRALIVRV